MTVKDNQEVEIENEEDFDYEDDELDEATAAADTLRPSGDAETWSKSEILSKLLAYASGMEPEDLTHFFHQSIAQIGHEADNIPGNAQAVNRATIEPKASSAVGSAVKEDVAKLFAGQENLTEGFLNEAATLFEAAVQNRVIVRTAEIEEEYEAKFEADLTEAVENLSENVSDYMDYMAGKWMEDNELALENGFRTEAVENFMYGLKDLFSESFIDVPEDKVDVVDEMALTIEELQGELENALNENMELERSIVEAQAEAVFEDVTEGMVATDVERFRALSEGIDFDDMDNYGQRLSMVREKYFPSNGSAPQTGGGLLNEEDGLMFEEEDTGDDYLKGASPAVRSYAESLSRLTRNQKIASGQK